jgi:hypothetical protein
MSLKKKSIAFEFGENIRETSLNHLEMGPGIVVHYCNPSTQEAEAGGS